MKSVPKKGHNMGLVTKAKENPNDFYWYIKNIKGGKIGYLRDQHGQVCPEPQERGEIF